MALTSLVDTSALNPMGHPLVRQAVEPLAARAELARARICDLEVGFSDRNGVEWDQLLAALAAFVAVETTAAHIHRALQVQRLLARGSQRR